MKSRSPVTRQGWRWVLCGAGSAQRQDARLQRPGRHSPSCVFVWPAPALCCAPDCSLSGHQPLYPHHHTSVGNTANGTHKITLRITCTWLAWLGGWVVLSESWIYILHTWYPCHILPAIVVNTSNGTHKVWVFSAGPSPVRGDRGILTNLI